MRGRGLTEGWGDRRESFSVSRDLGLDHERVDRIGQRAAATNLEP